MDSPPGSSVHRFSSRNIFEWVVVFLQGSSRPVDRTHISVPALLAYSLLLTYPGSSLCAKWWIRPLLPRPVIEGGWHEWSLESSSLLGCNSQSHLDRDSPAPARHLPKPPPGGQPGHRGSLEMNVRPPPGEAGHAHFIWRFLTRRLEAPGHCHLIQRAGLTERP